jgi:hypothetical protein
MASKQDVIASVDGFADALSGPNNSGLANDGRFSAKERQDFALLNLDLRNALGQFVQRPKFGEDSAAYDSVVAMAENGQASCADCQPGDFPSQESTFDLTHACRRQLEALTGFVANAPTKPSNGPSPLSL